MRLIIEPIVRAALLEDLGRAGDITTEAIVPEATEVEAVIAARQSGVIAGLDAALLAFELIDPTLRIERVSGDGARVSRGDVVARISGRARGVLGAERTALNLLSRMSGIATATRALADAVAGTKAKIVCTRKTTPGLRMLEKQAVRLGGGANHRFGLDDAMLGESHGCGATDYCRFGGRGSASGVGRDLSIAHRTGEPCGAGRHYSGLSRRAFGLCRGAGDGGKSTNGNAMLAARRRTGGVGGAGRPRPHGA
ncbi:MAG TPA: hypothetical protein VHY78_04610 [Stellaceae bacterium]|nr:hypothetical protein [Stellaceae bacterium]